MLRNIKSNSCLRGGCSGWVGNCRIGGKAAVLQVPRRWQRPSLQLGWFTSKARYSHQCWRSHNTSTRFTWTSSTQADSHLAPTALDESLPWRDVPSSPPRVTRWLLVVVTTAGTILVQHQLVEERRQSASEWRRRRRRRLDHPRPPARASGQRPHHSQVSTSTPPTWICNYNWIFPPGYICYNYVKIMPSEQNKFTIHTTKEEVLKDENEENHDFLLKRLLPHKLYNKTCERYAVSKGVLLVTTISESQFCSTRGTAAIVCSILPILSIGSSQCTGSSLFYKHFYPTTELGRDHEKIYKVDNFPFFLNTEMSMQGWEALVQWKYIFCSKR